MALILAESIPPETRAWAMLWLVVLFLGMLGLLMVVWLISRQRIHRFLGTGPERRARTTVDPWTESARRLDPDGFERPGDTDGP